MKALSREPDRDGSLILRMISDLFRQHGFKSGRDVAEYCSRNTYSREREQKMSEELQELWGSVLGKEFPVVMHRRVLCIDPERTDFWDFYTRGMSHNKRKSIISTFVNDLHYYVTSGNYDANPHKSRDDEYFKKYLQHIAIKGITVSKMMDILDKLNVAWMLDEMDIRRFNMSGDQIRMNYQYKIFEEEGIESEYEKQKKFAQILLRRCEEEGI